MKPPPGKPSFALSIAALRTTDPRYDWVRPTPDEADAADALEIVYAHHDVDAADDDERDDWGPCNGCGEPWPCKTWMWADQLATQWVGRAQDRHYRGAVRIMAADPATENAPRPGASMVSSTGVLVHVERKHLQTARDTPVTPAYCREPRCITVVSVPHPLVNGWLHTVTCDRHRDTTNDRYADEIPTPAGAADSGERTLADGEFKWLDGSKVGA